MFYQDIHDYIISLLKSAGIKHEINEFPSGCKMIDIWHNKEFYCVQIEEGFVGFSHIKTEADGFDAVPDFKFTDLEKFKTHFEWTLNSVS